MIPGGTEWQQHPVVMASEECSPLQLNSRMSTSDQRVTVGGSSVQSVTGWPFTVPAADVDFSGTVENEDEDRFQAALKAYGNEKADYVPHSCRGRGIYG